MSRRIKIIPKFASEAAERAFWEKSDSSGYLDWKKARRTVLPKIEVSYPEASEFFERLSVARSTAADRPSPACDRVGMPAGKTVSLPAICWSESRF